MGHGSYNLEETLCLLRSSISGMCGVSVVSKAPVVLFFILNLVVVREIRRLLVRFSEIFKTIHGYRIFPKHTSLLLFSSPYRQLEFFYYVIANAWKWRELNSNLKDQMNYIPGFWKNNQSSRTTKEAVEKVVFSRESSFLFKARRWEEYFVARMRK